MLGSSIPRRYKSLHMLGNFIETLVMDGVTVWSSVARLRTFDTSGNFPVPVGVTSVRLCGTGCGGGGSSTNTLGGEAGGIISGVDIPVTPGESIPVTIGVGGISDTDGSDVTFGSYVTLAGGKAGVHQGEGAERVTCGGRYNDGELVNTYYGGQASTFSDGGDGEGQNGEFGSGGGAGVIGGTGGQGRITVRWSEGD